MIYNSKWWTFANRAHYSSTPVQRWEYTSYWVQTIHTSNIYIYYIYGHGKQNKQLMRLIQYPHMYSLFFYCYPYLLIYLMAYNLFCSCFALPCSFCNQLQLSQVTTTSDYYYILFSASHSSCNTFVHYTLGTLFSH